MEVFKEAYFSKSGMMIGKELRNCFNCTYCRVFITDIEKKLMDFAIKWKFKSRK